MTDEVKELSVEEMKKIIETLPILEALLGKIEAINKEINSLKTGFNTLFSKYEELIKSINEYKDEVKENTKKSNSLYRNIDEELENIKDRIANIETLLSNKEEEDDKKKKKEEVDPDEETVKEIVEKILEEKRGRTERRLTKQNIIDGFKCSEEIAQKVLTWFLRKKMYNPKTAKLTFPKTSKDK